MGSTILSLSKEFTSLGLAQATVELNAPLRFDNRAQRQSIRLIKASFSTHMPNVYSIDAFNNGLIRISNDGGATWTDVQLQNGIYTANYIESAINASAGSLGYWADPTKVGYEVKFNKSTQIFYVSLDSTLCAAPAAQLGLDFSQSEIWKLLGFDNPANRTFITDTLHSADSVARMNWFGDTVSIILNGFGALSIRNGALSNEIASVPLSATQSANEYVYPQGIYTPIIPLNNLVQEVRRYSVELLGSRIGANNQQMPIYITEGNIELTFELMWS